MYTIEKQLPLFDKLNEECKGLIQTIFTGLTPVQEGKLIERGSNLIIPGKCYLIKEGQIALSIEDKAMIFFESGDFVGLEEELLVVGAKVSSEFALKANEYELASVLKHVESNEELRRAWSSLMIKRLVMQHLHNSSILKSDPAGIPQLTSFTKGEVIIKQGTLSTDVYTLVEGVADVLVDGIKVGQIQNDEIFGALAAFTGSARTADVVAITDVLALVLSKDGFIELIEKRPHTVFKLLEDMAKSIVNMNDKVVGMHSAKLGT